jgi:hypothetical protein
MTPELDEKLCTKYPLIFAERNGNVQETCMYWGLSIGDGWYNIIDQLCAGIQYHIDGVAKQRAGALEYNHMRQQAHIGNWVPFDKYYDFTKHSESIQRYKKEILESTEGREVRDLVPQVVAKQVKEKFGTLRFYYSGGDEYIAGLMQMADSMSSVTCDECGAPGNTGNSGGWIAVRCDAHKPKKK